MVQATTTNDGYKPDTGGSFPILPMPDDPRYRTYVTSIGWECPRCERINNPRLDQCPCKPVSGLRVTTHSEKLGEPPIKFCTGDPWNEDDYVSYRIALDEYCGFVYKDLDDEER